MSANPFALHWSLEPGLDFLNHGSFGACPIPVLAAQQHLRDEIERQPVEFFLRRLEPLLDAARERLAAFVGADPQGLVFVPNATAGVNAVLRSLRFEPGDELLTTDHAYNACRNTLDYVAQRHGARVVTAKVPFPLREPSQVVAAVMGAVGPRTRLALLDHVTSPTALVLPIAELVAQLEARGVDVLVDGAHAPGMVPLSIDALGAAYYAGHGHKWLCAPKGAAFLVVREDRRDRVVPLVLSHGANRPRPGRSRFHDLFDWTGTDDPTPFLCLPVALDFLASLVPGGWPELMDRNHAVAVAGRRIVVEALGSALPCPDEMIGSTASIPLPGGVGGPPQSALATDPLQARLLAEARVEVPIPCWPAPPKRLLRISAQLYNDEAQYLHLATVLPGLL